VNKMLPKIKSLRGFTLIELLVVIAILSILLVIVLVAINPAKQTRDARNTQRRADVLTILNSVNQYFVANGVFPTGVATGSAVPIKSASGGTGSTFCTQLVPDYVAALPFDPKSGYSFSSCTTYDTGYEILETAGDRVTVSAPSTEPTGSTPISATR
jgi:prepilin-type N-terminal cleavage/methylation domain-containing protein